MGSSFKPYVLAEAVKQNMNVQSSQLDGYESICVPDDQYPQIPSLTVKGTGASACPVGTPYGYRNYESIGESNGPVSATDASALSLNTAYADLIHRVGTQNVIDIAQAFGVNTGPYPQGSNLQNEKGGAGYRARRGVADGRRTSDVLRFTHQQRPICLAAFRGRDRQQERPEGSAQDHYSSGANPHPGSRR